MSVGVVFPFRVPVEAVLLKHMIVEAVLPDRMTVAAVLSQLSDS